MHNFHPAQLNLLRDALTVDVLVQKNIVAAANHLHQNPGPDLKWLDATYDQITELIASWEKLKEKSASESWFGSSKVEAYFQCPMLEIPGHLARSARRVRERMATGETLVYSEERLKLLTYVPENYHNADTQVLAGMLGFSLD
jgi:hypothetical protein